MAGHPVDDGLQGQEYDINRETRTQGQEGGEEVEVENIPPYVKG